MLSNVGDDSNGSDNEVVIGPLSLTPTSMFMKSALSLVELLIDFVHVIGLWPVLAQQLEAMHTVVVNLKLP